MALISLKKIRAVEEAPEPLTFPALRPLRSLYDFYNGVFEGVLADTEHLKQECHRIRYQVYCEEYGFEDSTACPNKQERDKFDDHSIHALLRHRDTGLFVGTVRMILQAPGAQLGVSPIYELCSQNNLVMPQLHPLENVTEISRFCILKDFRRRFVDSTAASSSYTMEELEADSARIIPSMSLGLIGMLVLMSKRHNIKQWCAEMEPFLIRLLSKLGIHFDPVGPLIEFHGRRQICYRPLDALLAQVKKERPDVWEIITDKGQHC